MSLNVIGSKQIMHSLSSRRNGSPSREQIVVPRVLANAFAHKTIMVLDARKKTIVAIAPGVTEEGRGGIWMRMSAVIDAGGGALLST